MGIAHDFVARHGNALGAHGAVDDFADARDVVVEVVKLATDARVQRRIGGYASEGAPARSFFDLVEIGGIEKELHFSSFICRNARTFWQGPIHD